MTVIAVGMVRDELDILEPVLRHLIAEGVDRILLNDNMSTDGTSEMLARLQAEGLPILVNLDEQVGFYQDVKTSRLARQAYELGADWVLPFDADEIWYGVDPKSGEPCRISDALSQVDPEIQVVRAPGWDHIQIRDDAPSPFSNLRRRDPQKLAKVAFRAHPDARLHMGNHDVTLPGPSLTGPLAFRHFQYRSLRQMTTKLRNGREAYEASDVHPMHGTHWRAGGLKSDAELAAEWAELCAEDGLIFDPAPIRVRV